MSQALNHSGFAVEWRPLVEVAAAIGCHDQTLRNFAKAGRLELQPRPAGVCCQAFRAYDLAAASRRRPASLRKPAGYDAGQAPASSSAGNAAPLDPEIVRALGAGVDPYSMDPHELSRRLLGAGVDQAKVRLAVQISNAQQRKREGEIRAGKNLPPDDVIRMIRSFGELFIEQIDDGAAAAAAELLRLLRERYGQDLLKTHPNAAVELEDFYRGRAQAVLVALRRHVDDQTHGLQRLNLEAEL